MTMRSVGIARGLFLPVLLGAVLGSGAAHAATSPPHGMDMAPVLAGLVLILFGAKLGGSLFAHFGQSPVVGELLVGVVLGNLGLRSGNSPRSRCSPRSACSSCCSR